MIRGHAGADEPERRRQDVVEVDLETDAEQLVDGVEAGRTGADDSGAQAYRVHGVSTVAECAIAES